MADSTQKQLPPYGLRIPPEMKERLQKSAKENNRSMHAEIIARLEASFDPPSRWSDRDRAWFTNQMAQQVLKHLDEWTPEDNAAEKLKQLEAEERAILLEDGPHPSDDSKAGE